MDQKKINSAMAGIKKKKQSEEESESYSSDTRDYDLSSYQGRVNSLVRDMKNGSVSSSAKERLSDISNAYSDYITAKVNAQKEQKQKAQKSENDFWTNSNTYGDSSLDYVAKTALVTAKQNELKREASKEYATSDMGFKQQTDMILANDEARKTAGNATDFSSEAIKSRADTYEANKETIAGYDEQIKAVNQKIVALESQQTQANASTLPEISRQLEELKAEKKELESQKGALDIANNKYVRSQKVMDTYYPYADEEDFEEDSMKRDYQNPTRQDFEDYATKIKNGVVYDADGVARDAFGNEWDETEPEITDKLGLWRNENSKAGESFTGSSYETQWEAVMKEGADSSWNQLTLKETAIYYYLLDNQGQDAAYKYLDDMKVELNRRETEQTEGRIESNLSELNVLNPIDRLEWLAYQVASVPANVYGGLVSVADDALSAVTGSAYNPYSKGKSISNFATAVRSSTAEDIYNATGQVEIPWLGFGFDDAYQAVMSGLDSLLGVYTLGTHSVSNVSNLYTLTMGFSAASTEAKELYEQGASSTQIALGAITTGVAESLFEEVSLDHFLSMKETKSAKQFVMQVLSQAGVEGSEEMATEIANTITNALIMKDDSEWAKLYEEGGFEEAFLSTLKNVINAGIGGFISGAGMAAGGAGSSLINYNRSAVDYAKQDIADYKGLGIETAMDYAKDNSETTASKETGRLLAKTESTAKADDFLKNAGKLMDSVSSDIDATALKAGIRQYLEENNKDSSDKSVNAVYKVMTSTSQTTLASTEAKETAETLSSDREFIAKVRSEANTARLKSVQATTDKRLDEFARNIKKEDAEESVKERVSDGDTAVLESSGESVEVKGIKSIRNGKMTLELTDGRTVDSSDVLYASESDALIYESMLSMEYDTQTANAIVQAYNAKPSTVSAVSFIYGINEAYNLGKINYPTEGYKGRGFYSELTPEQQKFGYDLGQKNATKAVKSEQKKVDKKKGTATATKKGRVYFTSDIKSTTTERQRASLEAIGKVIADATNATICIYESVVDEKTNKRVLATDVNGHKAGEPAPNGMYNTATGVIYIDINAGNGGEGTMLWTLAHELTHFVKEWSPAKFKVLADFLTEQYGKQGTDVETLIRAQQEKAWISRKERLDHDAAYEEMVADSMETMFTDTNLAEKLAKLKQTDETLWQKIKNFIADLLAKIKEAYAGLDPQTREGQYVRQMGDAVEKISDLFAEAIVDAGEAYSSIEVSKIENLTEGAQNLDGSSLFQYRAMEHDMPEYRQMLIQYGMKESEVNRLFGIVDKVMDKVRQHLDILDYDWELDIDDRGFNPVKPNSDSLYKYSVDFSTLCRKRILQQMVQVRLQEALDRAITRDESIAIRDELKKIQAEGREIEVACALCYVESARMKSPEQVQKFLDDRRNIIADFFAGKEESTKDKMYKAEVAVRGKLSEKYHSEIDEGKYADPAEYKLTKKGTRSYTALKELPKFMADQIRDVKKETKKAYQPTAEEVELLDIADSLSTSDFTSPDGLSDLIKKYPRIFDAYTSFIRNATKSKGLEKDTWWRKGDSLAVGDDLIASMNSENGLRSQSWSDFQVIHTLDYIAAIIELSTRGAKMQAYTKVADYVKLMGNTNQMINLSLIPTAVFNGILEYDSVEGMPIETALELRKKYPSTVGTICIGISDAQIRMLLASELIDYVIPYHHSGMAKVVRKVMDIPTWKSYQDHQEEKNLGREEAMELAGTYGVELLSETDENYHKKTKFSDWFNYKEAQAIADEYNNKKASELTAHEKQMKKQYGKMFGSYVAMQKMADNYIRVCAERGLAPKFSNEKCDFTTEDNYWKLLIDRKMINQKTGRIIEQQAVKPIFNEKDILEILDDEVARYPRVKADQEYATKTVVKKFLSGEMESNVRAINQITGAVNKAVDNVTKVNILESAGDMDENGTVGTKLSSRGVQENPDLWTLKGSKIQRSNYGVGKQVGNQIYVHKNYASEIIPDDVWEKAQELIPDNFSYNTVMYDIKNPSVVRFDEAPDFDWAREPKPGKMKYVDTATGEVRDAKGNSNMVWHHKWQWVRNDYEGFDVQESYNWSKRWLEKITNPSGSLRVWNNLLRENGLPIDSEDNTYYSNRATDQKQTSEDTSLNQTAAAFTNFKFNPTDRILDYGGGRYDTAKQAMETVYPGIQVEVIDPYNRTDSHNDRIRKEFTKIKADAVTINNVLNVIDGKNAREEVIEESKKLLKPNGVAYFTIYEGDKSGEGRITKDKTDPKTSSWQNNQRTSFYVAEISQYYKNVKVIDSKFILASDGEIKYERTSKEFADNLRGITDSLKLEKLDMKTSLYSDRSEVELGTLFSGADTFASALDGMIHTQFAAENRPEIVAVYKANHGGVVFNDVMDIDPKDMPDIQYLQISPPCVNFSTMNNAQGEKPIDIELAKKVAEIISVKKPRAISIENVAGYATSQSMNTIRNALKKAGYKSVDIGTYKDSDYGGYTNRERVILRAMRDEDLPAVRGKVSKAKGWGEAAGMDFLNSLPDAQTVNPRMVESLVKNSGINPYKVNKPLLVFGESYKNKNFGHAFFDQTLPTIIAESGASRVFMPNGTVKEATPELLAKIMGIDGFKLPESKVTARRVIGNGIPAAITTNVMGPVIEAIKLDNESRLAKGESIRYSDRDNGYAPAFYSQMSRIIDGIKTAKVGADGVVSYLKGKGVKNDEIKWSGIEAFLEGKKSVTKEELQEFARGSMLQIEEETRTSGDDALDELMNTIEKEYGISPSYEDWIEGMDDSFSYNMFEKSITEYYEDGDITKRQLNEILKLGKEFGKNSYTKWDQYTLAGYDIPRNYRELLFKLPNSDYSNNSMRAHWNESGVLAHTRISDVYTEDGQKMLFVEEIQSDWHNALFTNSKGKSVEERNLLEEIGKLNETVGKFSGQFSDEAKATRRKAKARLTEIKTALRDKYGYDFATFDISNLAPDAPFRDTYTDFVMKRLIRTAAEEGYDSIGWTTAEQQSERWSDDYAEGYRIEYDQDIPKFMNKYGKKWGVKVDKVNTEYYKDIEDDVNNVARQTVWHFTIPEEMKQSVLYEGQTLYSDRDSYATESAQRHADNATRIFGLTDDPYKAGFMLTNGKMLNFRNENNRLGWDEDFYEMYGDPDEDGNFNEKLAEHIDHDFISEAFGNDPYFDEVGEFIDEGNIRMVFEEGRGLFEMSADIEPTKEQYATILGSAEDALSKGYRIVIDYKGENTYGYEQFNPKEKDYDAYDVVRNIKYFYTNGQTRSNLNQFRYSDRDENAVDTRTLLTNALESTVQNEAEKTLLNTYKAQIDILNKQQNELSDTRQKIREISFGKNTDRKQLPSLRKKAESLAKAINTQDKKLFDLEANKSLKNVLEREKKRAQKRAEDKARESLNAYKERALNEQKAIREKYKAKESVRSITRFRGEIRKIAEDLRQRLQNPTERKYVPAPFVNGIIDVVDMLDPTGRTYYIPGTDTVDVEKTRAKYDENSTAAMKYGSARQALLQLKAQYDSLKTLGDYNFSSEFNEEFSSHIQELAESVDSTPIREMSADQLSDVYDILSDIAFMIKTATRQIGTDEAITNYEAGQELIGDMDNVRQKGLTTGSVAKFFREWTLNPLRAVNEMSGFHDDARLVKLFEGLNEGRRKADWFTMTANKKFETLLQTKEDRKSFTDAVEKADIVVKDKDGNEVAISRMQAMQAVLTYERERNNANRNHLNNAVRFTNLAYELKGKYSEAFDKGYDVFVNDEFVAHVSEEFNEWDKRYMGMAREFFNKDSKDAVNEVSMQTKHRLVATEESYIPYYVNADYLAKESENVKFDSSLEGMGILKSVKQNASQQVVMRGLNTIIDDHIDKVSKIYGLTVPVRNFNKVFNMKQTGKDGGRSVKSAIRQAWGDGGVKLLDQAVADIQSNRRAETAKIISGIKSAFVVSTLANNISVWMKQAASYPTAGSILSGSSLLKNLPSFGKNLNELWNEIDEHTSQHWIRRKGMSTQELGEINQTHGWQNKLNSKLGVFSPMNWIQAMDVKTTAVLWLACKSEVEKNGTKQGDKDYWDKVTELYDKVIEETQPMYDSLHRAEITKNSALKNIIMFQTQPIQNSGILREGAMEYKMAKKEYGAKSYQAKTAGVKFRKAVTSQLASHFVFTAMTLLAAGLLHKMNPWRDDDEEVTAESVAKEFGIEFAQNVFGAVVPVFGSYAISAVEKIFGDSYYDVLSDPTVDKVNTTLDNLSKLKNPTFDNIVNAVCDIASYMGIPAKNAYNIVNGARLHIEDAVNGEFLSFEAGVDRGLTQDTNRAYKAYKDGDTDKLNKIISERIEDYIADGKDEKDARSYIKSNITTVFKPKFLQAYADNDNETMADIRKFMQATGIYDDVVETTQSWIKNSKK